MLPATAAVAADPEPGNDVRVNVEIGELVHDDARLVVVGEGPFTVGDELTVLGTDLEPDATYEVWLHSDPVLLDSVTTDADGDAELTVTIPAGTEPGEHHVSALSSATGVEVASEPFTVVAASTEPGDGGSGSDGTGGDAQAGSGSDGLATTGAGLTGLAVLAAVAVGTGLVLRRRATGRHTA